MDCLINAIIRPTLFALMAPITTNRTKISRETSRGTENDPEGSFPDDQEGEEGIDLLGVDLLYQMDIEDITGLRKHFFPETADEEWLKANPQGLSLSKTQFIQAMDSIAGSSVLSLCAAKLFDTLDIDDSGFLQWEEVLDAIIEKTDGSRPGVDKGWLPMDENVTIRSFPHCRGEMVIKIVPLETESTFCYAVISKLGRVGVYDGELNLLDSYRLGMKPKEEATRDFNEFDSGETEEKQHRRSSSTTLTDAIFVPDTYALLFASSDRSLHLYDSTGLVHVPLCHIMGLINVPTCLDYHSSSDSTKPSLLCIGDDHGDVTVMRFHQAQNSLFKKKHPDKLDNFYWSELQAQSDYVTYKVHKNVHKDIVRQITFCADNDTILTCSSDPTRTLVIRHIEDRREPYLFKLSRGIRCFHLDRALHVLVTGSSDHIVRIWNPVVTQQSLVSLYGHNAPVEDVRIIRQMSVIISLDSTGVIKVWDVKDEFCLQTVVLAFPCLKIPGKKIEFGARSIFPGPSKVQENQEEVRSVKEQPQPGGRTSISGSNIEEVETQMSALEFRVSEELEWQRDSIVVICCNYAAILNLNINQPRIMTEDEPPRPGNLLPPPTKDHYASGPAVFRSGEANRTPRGSIGSKSSKSSESSSTSLTMPKDGSATAPLKDLNKKRSQQRMKQEQMRMLVEQGAPHLALDLHDLEPITFTRPLPMTRWMREEGMDISDPERLLKARLQRESTWAVPQAPFSRGSSTKSSKSSKSATALRQSAVTTKGRQTPDWFVEKLGTAVGSSRESSAK